MRKKLTVLLIALFVLATSFAIMPKKANAIPAFAQKYHFACTVCHTVFPNLNPFGRAFWRNGFRLPNTNGTPADATQIANGVSLPNPWPIPIMVEGIIQYQHVTNENVNPSTDAFGIDGAIVAGGAFRLYTPLANSLSFYTHWSISMKMKQVFASLNGLGSGFGLPSHLLNLKAGLVTTASPYFYRQNPFGYEVTGLAGGGQNLSVGYDGEGGNLIHARLGGFALYGTPGYNLWYKFTVTNDGGSGVGTASGGGDSVSNAMVYTYQLKEYMPISVGQFEIGYYGATVAEPLTETGQGSWTNRVTVNGIDADLANDVYELGATYVVQSDSNPYANPSGGTPAPGVTDTSNGYSTFEVYGRYLFPTMLGHGVMLSADYAQYSWTHKNSQLAYLNNNAANPFADNSGLYGGASLPGTSYNGLKDALAVQAEINLALNAHLYADYQFTNQAELDSVDAGLDFAF